jgi:hypothetical protein
MNAAMPTLLCTCGLPAVSNRPPSIALQNWFACVFFSSLLGDVEVRRITASQHEYPDLPQSPALRFLRKTRASPSATYAAVALVCIGRLLSTIHRYKLRTKAAVK